MAVDDLMVDTFTSSLEPNELLTEIRVPSPSAPPAARTSSWSGRWATSPRWRSAVHVAMEDGHIGTAGIGLTAVGPSNMRAREAEESLAGAEPTEEAFAEAGRLAAQVANPMDDQRGSVAYKRNVVEVFVRRGLAQAVEAARGGRGEGGEDDMQVTVNVNGTEHGADVEPRLLLVHLLRESLRAHRHPYRMRHRPTAARAPCCSTASPSSPARCSRCRPTAATVTTVEGLHEGGALHPIQDGVQGGARAAVRLLHAGHDAGREGVAGREPSPSDDEVRWAISGNICRCTGYMNIVKAVQAAGQKMSEAAEPAVAAS